MLDAELFTKTPSLFKAVYRECLWNIKTNEKKLYLTFDDGPVAGVTSFVLDELKRWNAKATFFCIGKNIEANAEVFKRIIDEGHSVGNHTYEHLDGWKTPGKIYIDNIQKCDSVLAANCQWPTVNALFRPPYGKLKPSQYFKLKSQYKLVMWDVLSFDFDPLISGNLVLQNVIKNAREGSIVVFHDSLKAKAKMEFALPKVLEYFTTKGFKFEKL